ncbi:hypothetical protein B0H13DRAFT_1992163 [Mycena leptocephala]|nr:hypothetical protein B0H13DRAFT_1992163 [Mycena leptocephala]
MVPTTSAVLTLWTKTIPRNSIVSTKILCHLRCSSGLASTPVIRPATTWDYRARRHLQRSGTKSDLKRARDWVSIPEKNLPEPWTCDWARWPLLENRLPVEAVLPMRYAIGEEPLIPIMFASDNCAALDIRRVTLFACPQTNTFYLYRAPSQVADPGFEAEGMWRFDGVFSSVGAFIEKADWNRVEKIEARNDEDEGESCLILTRLVLINLACRICRRLCIQEHTPGFFCDGRPGRCQSTIVIQHSITLISVLTFDAIQFSAHALGHVPSAGHILVRAARLFLHNRSRTLVGSCAPRVAVHPRLPPPRAVVVQVGIPRRDGRLVRQRRKLGGQPSAAVRADARQVRASDVCSPRIRARGCRPLSTQRGWNILSVVQRRPLP